MEHVSGSGQLVLAKIFNQPLNSIYPEYDLARRMLAAVAFAFKLHGTRWSNC